MLGYLENYRACLAEDGFHAILCFVADHHLRTMLCDPGGGVLTLLGAHSHDATSCKLAAHLDAAVKHWLNRRSRAVGSSLDK
jgi:hypothetical protein